MNADLDPSTLGTPPDALDGVVNRVSRRSLLLRGALVSGVVVLAVAVFGGFDSAKPHNNSGIGASVSVQNRPEELPSSGLLNQAGQSLLNMRDETPAGWRFKSSIQAPHYQTDRDVGAAGVGMGFLVMNDYHPKDPQWLQAADQTAAWLTSVAKIDQKGGTFWPDYADDHQVSADAYTSFDDGAVGIGDFYWQLYERTHNEQYKTVALSTLQWTFAQAENLSKNGAPTYSWPWNTKDSKTAYYMGMGEGATGLVHTFATYYQRLQSSNPEVALQCKQYIDGTLRYMDQARQKLGLNGGDSRAMPETGVMGQDGDTTMNSGYLSGAAGMAYMYLKLYQTFGDSHYLAEADKLFGWLEDSNNGPMVTFEDGSVAWKLALDPQGGDDTVLATGFEEGNAGIGWTYLQAYKVTGQKHYLTMAMKSADWLSRVAVRDSTGLAWHEYEQPTKPIIHANLNNGSAGIGMFLRDLAEVSGNTKYKQLAQLTLNQLAARAMRDKNHNIYWKDNDGGNDYLQDPSWHWGTAGIIGFIARMSGGAVDIPGEQPALSQR